MKDYSQFGEQQAIIESCPKLYGRFLDIGAYDPFQFSNTRALIEYGWHGLMVEPEPRAMARLLREYGGQERITLLGAAVGYEEGLARLHVTEDATATISDEHFRNWSKSVRYDGVVVVPQITLAQISLWYGGFDFVNIDVEGHSADLFVQLHALQWEPTCICVEHDNRMTELCARASARGYRMTHCNGTNAVFAR